MKKESIVRYVLRITFTLLAIAVVVAAALAIVNNLTSDAIAQSTQQKTQDAIALVLPGDSVQPITGFNDQDGLVSTVYKGETGYAVEVKPIGFDNTITMMVGIRDGKVTGISIISHSETAGLGAVAAQNGTKGENFRNQFIGQSGEVSVENGAIDALTGATVTSRAICAGVNAALKCVEALEGGSL